MQNSSTCIFLLRIYDSLVGQKVGNLVGHDRRVDEPRRDDVHSHANLHLRSAQTSHDSSHAPFRGTILRRARLVEVTRETCGHDEAAVATFGVAGEVVGCKLYCVHYSGQINLQDLEIWFYGIVVGSESSI